MKSFFKYYFSIITVLYFIPIGRIAFFPIAPVNFFLYLLMLLYFVRFPLVISRIRGPGLFLIFIVLAYTLFDVGLSYFKGAGWGEPKSLLRNLLIIVLACVFIEEKKDVAFALKIVLFSILFSTIFGLFIHFIGEPFQSIRMYLLNVSSDNVHEVFLGKGDRIAGLFSQLPGFAYQLTAGAVMALGLYIAERKTKWIVVLCILMVGIIYNGERASILMFLVAFVGMLFTSPNKKALARLFLLLVILSSVFIGMNQFFESQSGKYETSSKQTLLHRESSSEEFLGRLFQQYAGIKVFFKNPFLGGTDQDYQNEMAVLLNKSIKYPAPHNHYINVIMKLGVWGVILLTGFFLCLYKMLKSTQRLSGCFVNEYSKTIFWSIFSVLGVALFHNHGFFVSEISTWFLIAILCGSYTAMFRRNDSIELRP